MEAAYLDEIEQLRSVITRLQQEKTSISTPRVDDNSLLLYNLEGRVEKSEEKVALLTKELDLAKKREADLLEQLNSFVNKVDSISEVSLRWSCSFSRDELLLLTTILILIVKFLKIPACRGATNWTILRLDAGYWVKMGNRMMKQWIFYWLRRLGHVLHISDHRLPG